MTPTGLQYPTVVRSESEKSLIVIMHIISLKRVFESGNEVHNNLRTIRTHRTHRDKTLFRVHDLSVFGTKRYYTTSDSHLDQRELT